MGIRYYAYPIAAEDYETALEDPCPFHGSDPFADAWGSRDARPEMLYLDKCWHELQQMFGPNSGASARPAFALVEGQVTHVEMGWIPYERALSPREVQEIASDIATVGDDDIRKFMAQRPSRSDDEQEFSYVQQFLGEAQHFVTRLANDGRGLVYMIG